MIYANSQFFMDLEYFLSSNVINKGLKLLLQYPINQIYKRSELESVFTNINKKVSHHWLSQLKRSNTIRIRN